MSGRADPQRAGRASQRCRRRRWPAWPSRRPARRGERPAMRATRERHLTTPDGRHRGETAPPGKQKGRLGGGAGGKEQGKAPHPPPSPPHRETGRAGSVSGLGKRTGRNSGTAPRAHSTNRVDGLRDLLPTRAPGRRARRRTRAPPPHPLPQRHLARNVHQPVPPRRRSMQRTTWCT